MFKLGIRNLYKKPIRTLLSISTVVVSIVLLLSLLGFYVGYNKAMEDELANFGVQMIAVPKGCPYSSTTLLLHGGVIPNKLPLDSLTRVKDIKHVMDAKGIVMGTLEIKGQTGTQVVYGIEPGFERLRPNWKAFSGNFPTKIGEAMIGSSLAKKLGFTLGQKITVIGTAQDKTQQEELGTYPSPTTDIVILTYKTDPRELEIVGFLDQTGSSEDNFVIVSDEESRKIVDLNGYTAIAVEIEKGIPDAISLVSSGVEKINDAQPVTISQVANTMKGLVDSARAIMLAITIVAIIACAIVVAGSALMGVIERTKEIGMMRTIGALPIQVGVSVLVEVVAMTLLGGLIGALITYLLQGPLSDLIRLIIPNAPNAQLIMLEPPLLLLSVGVAVVVGLVAAIPPLISVMRAPALRLAAS